MLSFKAVSRVDYFLGVAYLILSVAVEFKGVLSILYIGFGILAVYKAYLMYRNLQPSSNKPPLNAADIKPCKRYMLIQLLLALISLAFVFIPYSDVTILIYLLFTVVLVIYASAPLKTVFEGIF